MSARPRPGRLRIVFGGAFARVPLQGGLIWVVLHYVLGLRRLGHDVLLVEAIDSSDVLPKGAPLAASRNGAELSRVARAFGLESSSALFLRDTGEVFGMHPGTLRAAAREADLLIDIAGGLRDSGLVDEIPTRVYLDLDPGFTQLWHELEEIDMRLDGYTHFATVGLCLDQPSCTLPQCGVDWIPTPQPIVLEHWPFAEGLERDALTTVANWRGYGSIEVDGVHYGQKAHSLRRFIDLPRRTGGRFELALAIDPGEPSDLAALAANGWTIVDPRAVAGTPEDYRRFVQGSRGELGVAKSGYVAGRAGWFSDRSVCYLASGRPVVAQDTGFRDYLPVGAGLFCFEDAADVQVALEELARDYPRQRRAARAVASEVFDSDVVLPRLLEKAGVA